MPSAACWPRSIRVRKKKKSGDYVGIGVEVEIDGGAIQVQALGQGGAAELGGVRPGDAIIAIDGAAVSGMDLKDMGRRMRGAPGSADELELLRPLQAAVALMAP